MSATVTVDGTIGNGQALADVSFTNIRSFKIDTVTEMLELVDLNDKVTNISIAAAATMTVTITAPDTYVVDIDN